MMLGLAVDIDTAALARVQSMLDEVASQSPVRLATETRRAALYICQALKKRTRKAPKKIPRREYSLVPSSLPPRYLYTKAENRLMRRWALTRKVGTPAKYTMNYFAYTKARRGRNGKMIGKQQADEKRQILARHGSIPRSGLAKKSWGWIAKGIYAASTQGDLSWRRTNGERRNPQHYVKGTYQANSIGAFARIRNSLDYIREILPLSAISDAISASARRLRHNIMHHIERITK